MLRKLRIGQRLIILIAIQTLVLLIISITALAGLNFASDKTGNLNKVVADQARLSTLAARSACERGMLKPISARPMPSLLT